MDYIFIDTSIFEANNFIESKRIKEIFKLSTEGHLKIILPEITYNEILNRARKNFEEAIKGFKKYRRDTRILRNIDSLSKKFDPIDDESCQIELIDAIKKTFKSSGVVIIDYPTINTRDIFESYFNKKKPFGSGIKKDEFPDAFALISMEKWCKDNNKKCFVFAKDKDIIEYESDYIKYNDFDQYLDEKLKELELLTEKAARLKRVDELFDANQNSFNQEIENWLLQELDDDTKYYEHLDYLEVHDLDIQNLEADLYSYQIISTTETTITLEGEAVIQFAIEIETDDEGSGYYDDEDKVWHYLNTKTVKIDENKVINVELKYEIPTAGEKYAELVIEKINEGDALEI